MNWEVWTMKSRTSFCNPTLLKKNAVRFAPVWAVLFTVLFISGPVVLLRNLQYQTVDWARRTAAETHLTDTVPFVAFFSFVAAMICAGMVFKYLHKANSAYMMHAFPLPRQTLFVTNVLSGLLFFLVPALAVGLIYTGILLTWSGLSGCIGLLWITVLRWVLAYLFFYGLAVFCMLLSGNTIIAVLSYAALNFLALLLPILVLNLVQIYFYGFDFTVTRGLLRLSPLVALMSEDCGLCLLTVYACIGLALLVLAWLHYRVRQVERAGDAMVCAWGRVAFRLLFTLGCALGLGWILALITGAAGGEPALLPYVLIGCFLGWFGASMMLERTVAVFNRKKFWLGFGVFAAVLAAAILCLRFDVLGFERRIPERGEVVSVEIWTLDDGSNLYGRASDRVLLQDAAAIDAVRAVHANALDNRVSTGIRDLFYSGYNSDVIHIVYHLSGGGTLRRSYQIADAEGQKLLGDLYSRPDAATAYYEKLIPDHIERVVLSGLIEEGFEADGTPSYAYEDVECSDPGALKAAILSDAAAGRLPIVNGFARPIDGDSRDYTLFVVTKIHRSPEWGEDYEGFYLQLADAASDTLALFGQ